MSIRFCSFENAQQNVWRILDVQANSPAFQAGLISQKDFIIGADTLLNEVNRSLLIFYCRLVCVFFVQSEDFFSLIKSSDGKNLKLFVYNCKVNACREVNLLPNSSWGGEGLLGCGIGVGYLHRIPTHCCSSEFSSLSEAPTILTHQKEVTPLLCHQDGFANPMNAAPSKAELNNVVPSLSLPAIITEINLPGLPPCNVAVPSLDLMGQGIAKFYFIFNCQFLLVLISACTSTVNSTTPLQFAVS